MVRAIHRLKARQVETLTKPGRHADGGNLYLSIASSGAKRWTFLYRSEAKGKDKQGKSRPAELGLGSASKGGVSLLEARRLAQEARDRLAAGIDPQQAKRDAKASALIIPTFGQVADDLIASMKPGWHNPKHAAQWTYTLTELAAPLRSRTVDRIETRDILEVLKPIWQTVPETASRLRGRIEAVLNAAKAKGYRSGENPARWRGHLDQLLPKRQRLTRGHHAALPYQMVSAFVAKLRKRQSIASRALEFAILTAARTGEVINAEWKQIDLGERLWIIPASRMKAKREHRIPLSDRAGAILKELAKTKVGPFVFGETKARGLSSMALLMLIRRMDHADITAHGFRSSFRDWASETTSFPHEICEMALAHVIANKAEAAYRRGDLLAKRRQLMEAWAGYCDPTRQDKVIPLAKTKQ